MAVRFGGGEAVAFVDELFVGHVLEVAEGFLAFGVDFAFGLGGRVRDFCRRGFDVGDHGCRGGGEGHAEDEGQ